MLKSVEWNKITVLSISGNINILSSMLFVILLYYDDS